ncbi:protein sorting system archaetidylserine decarboxylase [Halobacterium litoreum]|uniref:Putative archaetidylserine decarboxylase proenzyme n=1 Tax=Halobacterium litoreum TaxID=2039234 RepID=A0ABD5NFU4_9EURY|nr:protein sorting system archaetidylserine decarboxylase [Halobacterium litoreum]UHH13189.1 protein sorting system archaetidylserine decarboxylase [Halobacterium litoreum]
MLARGSWKFKYLLPPAVVGAALLAISSLWGVLGFALAGFVAWFHRDPERSPPPEWGAVSPADGKVSVIREEGDRVRVGVFMNVHNVHVNRAPLDGTVEDVTHEPGGHRPAFDKESEHNERVHVDCGDYEVVLIAGAFARRIHPYVEAGEELARGDRIGHISFGSRVDLVLPERYDREDVLVEDGETVQAGETVLARRQRTEGDPDVALDGGAE